MNKHSKSIRTIAVALKLSGASGRDILAGISTYARERCHWRFRIFSRPEDFTPEAIREIPRLDGIITSEHEAPDIAEWLESSSIPLVVIGMKDDWLKHRANALAFVRNDDEDIGRLGASHLYALGHFCSFGFVPSLERTYWSIVREKGFRNYLRARSVTVNVYKPHEPLSDWLKALPKPAAVMAAFDERGADVLSACNEAMIAVPRQVAVVGVDNDELLCDFCDPPLTSILPNHVNEGETAARELDRLMRTSKTAVERTTRCRNKRLIVRESTAPLTPATHLVAEAMQYIRRYANSDLRAADVVRHLNVSRRLIDLRLHEAGKKPLAKLIADSRLDEVAQRLRKTNAPIGSIADACSFPNLQHLANAFKRRFGLTMTAYRVQTPQEGNRE